MSVCGWTDVLRLVMYETLKRTAMTECLSGARIYTQPITAAMMPGGRDDVPYLAKSSKLLYKAGWRDKPSSTHPESDCA